MQGRQSLAPSALLSLACLSEKQKQHTKRGQHTKTKTPRNQAGFMYGSFQTALAQFKERVQFRSDTLVAPK